eukprot:Gb_28829 [translate_table: standard]
MSLQIWEYCYCLLENQAIHEVTIPELVRECLVRQYSHSRLLTLDIDHSKLPLDLLEFPVGWASILFLSFFLPLMPCLLPRVAINVDLKDPDIPDTFISGRLVVLVSMDSQSAQYTTSRRTGVGFDSPSTRPLDMWGDSFRAENSPRTGTSTSMEADVKVDSRRFMPKPGYMLDNPLLQSEDAHRGTLAVSRSSDQEANKPNDKVRASI